MESYRHLTAVERDRIAALRAEGQSFRAIAQALGRSPATISRELRRNALASGAYRPTIAEGSYLLSRQPLAVLERDPVACRLRDGPPGRGLDARADRRPAEARCGARPALRLDRDDLRLDLPARSEGRQALALPAARQGETRPAERARQQGSDQGQGPLSRSDRPSAVARAEPGHWEADLVICKRARPVLVLHERKTRLTLMARLMGKTAAETIAVMMAVLKRLTMPMRGSMTFDNDTTFARHSLLRGLLSATTYFCDAYASWQKGGIENANGRIRRWLPRTADLDAMTEADIQEIAMTLNLTPRKCLGFKSPVEAFLAELGKNVDIRFHHHVALRA